MVVSISKCFHIYFLRRGADITGSVIRPGREEKASADIEDVEFLEAPAAPGPKTAPRRPDTASTGNARRDQAHAPRITPRLEDYRDVNELRIMPDAQVHPADRTLPVSQLRREPVTGIVPLEYFLIPPDLDGSCGTNRNVIRNNSGDTDRQAIDFWLADHDNPNTRRIPHGR